MKIIKLKIYSEICCDECNEVVHNHIDCPTCSKYNIDTNIYQPIWDLEIGQSLFCGFCEAEFRLFRRTKDVDIQNYEWEYVN